MAGGPAPFMNWTPGGSSAFASVGGMTPRQWAHANPGAYYHAYNAGHPWTPPPIPPNFYNPELDIERSEGKQGVFQAEQSKEAQESQAQNQFAVNLADLQAREGEQSAAHTEALNKLGETFRNLGARQGDQAAGAGVLYGGAALASAMARARNEGTQRGGIERSYGDQQAADLRERGKLALGLQQTLENLGLGLQQTQEKGQLYDENLTKLMGKEASLNGYMPPTRPAPPRMVPLGRGRARGRRR
jgi:hypothetical protein